ncbi:helix-turn-helix transcriptional regulator [Rahnella woolbedingensis]|uniref:Helix-turn-helix transcriptional regulator n=1 Tax=Rahnella woolbedingensis TaxID=1510574 RepID=A0A419N2P4_9GAMM|nr:helix-turn-helix transcriptional regulator [Rahnella woolbedingensis]
MPRVIIWSECQYTKLALKEIISKELPYVDDVISYDQGDEVDLYAKDYLIIDPSGGGFHRCYEFLRENLNILDPIRILVMSSAVDMLMLELLLKREFKFLKNKKELSAVVTTVEQLIQLQGITINKESFNYNITKMEEKVLVMMMSGLSVTSISNILKLSVKTISVHKCNSLRKIGVDANSSSALFFLHKHAVGRSINR